MGRNAGIAALGIVLALAACATFPSTGGTVRSGEATFRAVGNEPGWSVTVYPDSLVYVTNYGADHYTFTQFVTRPEGAGIYQTLRPDPHFEMTRSDAPCFDDMSGEPFEATVVLEFDGRTYRGCGNWLTERSPG